MNKEKKMKGNKKEDVRLIYRQAMTKIWEVRTYRRLGSEKTTSSLRREKKKQENNIRRSGILNQQARQGERRTKEKKETNRKDTKCNNKLRGVR
jgi:hypothetical protein